MNRLFFLALLTALPALGELRVGAGRSDVTGPPVGSMMQGYVRLGQNTEGIHTRLFSRAFVIADGPRRVALVTADLCQIPRAVKEAVLKDLKALFGDLYREENVLLAATHTHSGPGGYSHHTLYNLASNGYSPRNFEAIVQGIGDSIVKAHRSLAPARLSVARGSLAGASRNRSPLAYALNPVAERERYPSDVDRDMTLLRFDRADGTALGVLSWFAVHAVSMQSSNHLISGDNKGIAAWLFERDRPGFVAAFANANAGDVTPNTAGDKDGDGNWDCPLGDMFLCAKDSARRQYELARTLHESAAPLAGPLDYRHVFVDMSRVRVGGKRTCPGAIGLSMLAGTPDGLGVGRQGVSCSNIPFWENVLCQRDPCQGEKPVVLLTGRRRPAWTPQVLPLQLVRLGPLALMALPAELTTMSGRRLREAVLAALKGSGVREVVIAGYANEYSGYVATPEEYQGQFYEGASTHFGPWTLPAYVQESVKLARAMAAGEPVTSSVVPPAMAPPPGRPEEVPADVVPPGNAFGEVTEQPAESYRRGALARATFWGAHPNHDFRPNGTYLRVERREGDAWLPVAADADPETRFRYASPAPARSRLTVEWEIPVDTAPGVYRLTHEGSRKTSTGALAPYRGVSRPFRVD